MTKKENGMSGYNTLIKKKCYDEMNELELMICCKHDREVFLPKIRELQAQGVSDREICMYLYDLDQSYLICDAADLADAAGLSDEDYEKALDAYYREDFDNPWMCALGNGMVRLMV